MAKAPLTIKGLTNKFKSLGLVESTSPRQKTNGTLSFFDTETEVQYNFLKSGYYNRVNGTCVTPLNPTQVVKRKKNGSVVTKRILIKDRTRQMERALNNNILSYRD